MTCLLDGLTRPCQPMPVKNPGRYQPGTVQNRVRLRVVGPNERGEIVTKETTPWYANILTTYGLASMASAIGSSAAVTASAWVQAIYCGTSATAPASTDSSLGGSTASITIGNNSFTKTNAGNMTVEYQCTFASSNTSGAYTIRELGLYCNSTGNQTQNNMAAHCTLGTTVAKGASDVIQCSFQVIFTTA